MIVDFGPTLEYVRVTPQYSNAVLVAVLPHISDAAKALDVRTTFPLTPNAISSFLCSPIKADPGGAAVLTNGSTFRFSHGFVDWFQSTNSYFNLQDPDEISRFSGSFNMTETEAVQYARTTIKKLGVSLHDVFAELPPKVETPPKTQGHTVPRYRIEWLDPRSGLPAADFEINAEAKRVEYFHFQSNNIKKEAVKPGIAPQPLPPDNPFRKQFESHLNPAYANALLPIVLKGIEDCSRKFGLPVPRTLTTNNVQRFACNDNGGWPHVEIELTNGYRFVYRNDKVCGFYAPDNFFDSDHRKISAEDFAGKWKMSESEAIDLARKTIAKFGYSEKLVHTDFKPTVLEPTIIGGVTIPRYKISWMYPTPDTMTSWAAVEVAADTKTIKSTYFDDKSFWGHPPKINVPISLPEAKPGANR